MEDLCLQRRVALALVDGAAVDALSRNDAARIKVGDLLKCVHDMDATEDPARLDVFRPTRAEAPTEHAASAIIQALYRGATTRDALLKKRRVDGAAVRVQACARRRAARAAVLGGLALLRETKNAKWADLEDRLRINSAKKGVPRVEIHVPSLSLAEPVRLARPRFALEQAYQVARLLAAADDDVHVVYVSPFELPVEVVDYYRRLLALGEKSHGDVAATPRDARFGAGANGAAATWLGATEPAPAAGGRFTIVVPELGARFPSTFTLASLALYSPACCRRLRHLATCRPGVACVLVPGGPVGWAEKALSLAIDVPLLAPDAPVAALYGSVSGAKRCFHAADVNVPIGAHDIYDEEDFVVALAKLVAGHLDVGRWRFRVDADGGAAGDGRLDVDGLAVVEDLRGEKARLTKLDQRRGEAAWHHPDVQVLARRKLLRALRPRLRSSAVVTLAGAAPSKGGNAFDDFLKLVRRYGGVVEAEPRDVRGRCVAHARLEPDGSVEVVCCQDVWIDHKYQRRLCTFPARAAPAAALEGATAAVAEELHRGGVVGYFSCHYLVHGDDRAAGLRLWATDLELGLTPPAVGHGLHAVVAKDASAPYALFPHVYHAGLAATTFHTFFKLCRMHGVAFDVERRRGPVFALVDSLASGTLGCVAEGASRRDALRQALGALDFLRRHLETAHLLHHVPSVADRELPDLVKVVKDALRALDAAADEAGG